MVDRSLPLTVDLIPNESLVSYLARTAAHYKVSSENLLRHCLQELGRGPSIEPAIDDLAVHGVSEDIEFLAQAVRLDPAALKQATIRENFPYINLKSIAYTSAAKSLEDGSDIVSGKLRVGWCQRCLLEDRAGGGDHFMRVSWPLAISTICEVHQRPLIERCQKCFSLVNRPSYALYREQVALICPKCGTPLDAQVGYDFVSNRDAHRWNIQGNLTQCRTRISAYESHLRNELSKVQAGSDKFASDIQKLLDHMLKAERPYHVRAIDLYGSEFFPSPINLGYLSRDLNHPFRVSYLVERRKALSILIGLLEGSLESFGFRPGNTSLRKIRGVLSEEIFNEFEMLVFKLARASIPIQDHDGPLGE